MKLPRLRSKPGVLLGLVALVAGLGATIYASVVVGRYGFQVSGRWNPNQLESGGAPLFFLIGIALVIYGCVALWLHRR
ncbi:MAG: hypothetical protein KF823_12850 [Xanthomonadales bacterium]|nr:hypothetical protein [Xanthomonadales bacterium]